MEHVRETLWGVGRRCSAKALPHASMFHGYDFDSTMLRIGSMNMLMHGVESPDIRYRDRFPEGAKDDADKFTLIPCQSPLP